MDTTTRDDRILPLTHWVAYIIIPFLLAAFALLYFWPDNTDQLFAWNIKPRMTPLLMGAGYIGGAYFFVRAFFETRWHRIAIGFLPITAFTLFMALATFFHLDRFITSNVEFWPWVILYIVTPILVPLTWFLNRPRDPGTPEADDVIMSTLIRRIIVLVGALEMSSALMLLIFPDFAISIWPWKLTQLTSQVLAGWFGLAAVLALEMIFEQRWSALKITLESQGVAVFLTLVGVARAWSDFNTANLFTWSFVGLMVISFIGICALHISMEGQRRKARALPSPASAV